MRATKILIIITVSLIGSACASDTQSQTSPQPPESPTSSSPAATPPQTVEEMILQDGFSTDSTRWPERLPSGPGSQGLEVGYEHGGYAMHAAPGAKLSYLLPAPVRTSSNHVIVEVDAVHAGRHAIYGVFCKADARLSSAYLFTIDSTGSWAVAKLINGRLQALGNGTDPAIEAGPAVNHIRADCFDKEPLPDPVAFVRLFVNGEMVYSGRDREGLAGPRQSISGLFLETDFEGDAEIVFDNFAFRGVDPNTLP
jgi:hypothetical protein